MTESLVHTGTVFIVFFAMFLPLERLFALHKQRVFRTEWSTDVCFFLGQYLLFTTPVVGCLVWLHAQVAQWDLAPFHDVWHQTPFALQLFAAVCLSDLCIYWGHRLSHQLPFLWTFHRVHHTSPKLDWLAAHREHPIDNLYTRTIENLPIFILGFPLETIAGFVMFRGLWGLFIHSNVNIKLGWLKYLIGSPHLHHWHHAEEHPHCNFANLMPLMDVLFGTYYEPKELPNQYGIPDEIPHNYLRQLIDPIMPWTLLNTCRRFLARSRSSPKDDASPTSPHV